MDRWQAASKSRGHAQLAEGQVRLFVEQVLKLPAMPRQNHRFAACPMMLGRYISDSAPLLQQFLDHAQGDPKPLSHLLAGLAVSVIRGDDSFPDIQTYCFHATNLSAGGSNGYTII
ncbi:MAG: hypothetical protein KJ726_03840 [Verrucomicrobia bacterium]|nr:hypothetical protein [Verrucomicrobiota bacterium]